MSERYKELCQKVIDIKYDYAIGGIPGHEQYSSVCEWEEDYLPVPLIELMDAHTAHLLLAMHEDLAKLRGAVADIAFSNDMSPSTVKKKAERIYKETARYEELTK